MNKHKLKILFLGTPDFAKGILQELLQNNFNIAGVVTNIDKPSGRNLKITGSPVKIFAEENNLRIFQPVKLKDEIFLSELKALDFDLGVVVAFRFLPDNLWSLPRLGTVNLHASLLPDYRGAAPINHVLINGENRTGVTTFFLKHDIDAGKIIFREIVNINEKDNAGSLHDKLMLTGSKLLVKTLEAIESGEYPCIDQSSFFPEYTKLNQAPRIFKNDCRINWNNDVVKINNLVRGLSPSPCSWTTITMPDEKIMNLKIFDSNIIENESNLKAGSISTDNKTFFHVYSGKGRLAIEELQLEGKKRLKVKEFLIGFPYLRECKLV